MSRTESEIIANMSNVGDSGQDSFVTDWGEYAKNYLFEHGVSRTYIDSSASAYILGKMVTDLIEDGALSSTSLDMMASLRINHPHDEDEEAEGDV